MSEQSEPHSQQLDSIRLQLQTATSKQAAFLAVADPALPMLPPDVVVQHAIHFYHLFAAGAGGALVLAVAKGAAGEAGKAAGAKLIELWKRWQGGDVKQPTDEATANAQLAEATTALAEAVTELSHAVHDEAMAAGETQLSEHLQKIDFPLNRARTLAAEIRTIASAPVNG